MAKAVLEVSCWWYNGSHRTGYWLSSLNKPFLVQTRPLGPFQKVLCKWSVKTIVTAEKQRPFPDGEEICKNVWGQSNSLGSGCLPLQGSGWKSQREKLASFGMAGPQTTVSWGLSPGLSGSFGNMGGSCHGVQALFCAPVWFCWDFSMKWKCCCSGENAIVRGDMQSPGVGTPCCPAQKEDEQKHADTHGPSKVAFT